VEDISWEEGLTLPLQKKKDGIAKQISSFIDKTF